MLGHEQTECWLIRRIVYFQVSLAISDLAPFIDQMMLNKVADNISRNPVALRWLMWELTIHPCFNSSGGFDKISIEVKAWRDNCIPNFWTCNYLCNHSLVLNKWQQPKSLSVGAWLTHIVSELLLNRCRLLRINLSDYVVVCARMFSHNAFLYQQGHITWWGFHSRLIIYVNNKLLPCPKWDVNIFVVNIWWLVNVRAARSVTGNNVDSFAVWLRCREIKQLPAI